jgi:hypothetical protein
VRLIRLGCRSHPPSHGVELPHQQGIAVPSFGRGDLLDPVVPPESTHATESWDAAFRAHSCSRENEHSISGGNCEHQWKVYRGSEVHGMQTVLACSAAPCYVKRFNSFVPVLRPSEGPVRRSANRRVHCDIGVCDDSVGATRHVEFVALNGTRIAVTFALTHACGLSPPFLYHYPGRTAGRQFDQDPGRVEPVFVPGIRRSARLAAMFRTTRFRLMSQTVLDQFAAISRRSSVRSPPASEGQPKSLSPNLIGTTSDPSTTCDVVKTTTAYVYFIAGGNKC